VGAERLAHYPPVLQQSLGVRLGTQFVQELVEPSTSVKRKVTVPAEGHAFGRMMGRARGRV